MNSTNAHLGDVVPGTMFALRGRELQGEQERRERRTEGRRKRRKEGRQPNGREKLGQDSGRSKT